MQNSSNRYRALSAPGVRSPRRLWTVVLAALLALGAAISARAQSAGDPPSRAARLSEVDGQVWLYNTDTDEWITVARNQPLTSGDRIATDNGARAEITLGTTTLRLDAATELEIARLDDSRYSVRLRGGSVAARLRNAQSLNEFEMVTDEGRFRAQAVGRYRFDRFEQTSDVTVFNGQATYEARNTALPVSSGQHAQFWLDAAGVPQYAMVQPMRDAFAGWNDDRDRAEERPAVAATRYVSPEMTGAEDLDRYGQWEPTPEYGALWAPRSVAVDWAPYTTGHWAWVRPWGWTWVDDAPWGFAPFHYGRWVYHRNAWCWAPGTYVARPVYAPALVAWIGGPRANVSVSIGAGAPVGWFPLAPHEVYVPSYRSSARYQRDVNYTHVSNVTNITTIISNRNGEADRRDFANRKYAHAVTFVPADVMTRRQPVGPAAARFRNDPQVRALVAQAAPAPVLTAPPVTAPPVAPRAPQGRQAPRPPFETRAQGGARPDVGRPQGGRADARPDSRFGERPEGVRPGDRPAGPGSIPPRAAAPQAPAPAPGVTTPTAPQGVTPPIVGATPANPAATAGPPVRARGMVEPDINRPGFRGEARGQGGPGQVGGAQPSAPPRIAPPSAIQPSAPLVESAGPREPREPRESRRPSEGSGEGRGQRSMNGPQGPGRDAAPGQIPQGTIPQGTLPQRSFPPRTIEPPRTTDPSRAAEAQRPAPPVNRAVEAPVVVPRPAVTAPPPVVVAPRPAPVAPPVVQQRAPEGRPAEAPRGAGGEGRMQRPEAPRGRGEERREDKAEKQK